MNEMNGVSHEMSLAVTIGGMVLKNPVMPASGTYEVDSVHDNFFAASGLGAVVSKTVFLDERPGNPIPRICETPSGMLNAIGIPCEGIDAFIEHKLPRIKSIGTRVIISIAGDTLEQWADIACRLEDTGLVDALELNLSCPNLHNNMPWSTDEKLLGRVIGRVRKAVDIPVIAKLSPIVTEITRTAQAAEAAGASALSMINTYKGMVIDIEKQRPYLGNVTGGLSGPAVRPMALWAVYSSYKAVSIPIIGMGGIDSWQSAVEFLLAGATGIGIGMANFSHPGIMKEVVDGIAGYIRDRGYSSASQIIGLAHRQ